MKNADTPAMPLTWHASADLDEIKDNWLQLVANADDQPPFDVVIARGDYEVMMSLICGDSKHSDSSKSNHNPECQGLTKREYFAAKAMQAMVTSTSPEETASLAVHYADELLKALEKTNDPE